VETAAKTGGGRQAVARVLQSPSSLSLSIPDSTVGRVLLKHVYLNSWLRSHTAALLALRGTTSTACAMRHARRLASALPLARVWHDASNSCYNSLPAWRSAWLRPGSARPGVAFTTGPKAVRDAVAEVGGDSLKQVWNWRGACVSVAGDPRVGCARQSRPECGHYTPSPHANAPTAADLSPHPTRSPRALSRDFRWSPCAVSTASADQRQWCAPLSRELSHAVKAPSASTCGRW
jgi:hypothetical protein